MLHLYDRETSGNAYKVRLLLAFLGVPYGRTLVPLKDGKNQVDPSYLELNPRGQIPTLEDGALTLWGSTAALCYIATRYDASRTWLPTAPDQFAEVMQWLELAQNEIQSGLFLARAVARFGYPGSLAEAQGRAATALRTLEWRLEANAWLVGPNPTIADIACFPYAALAGEGQVDVSPYRGVQAWIRAVKSLSNFTPMSGL
jgi:glutathione S-transferase